jgi:hypothetical protein
MQNKRASKYAMLGGAALAAFAWYQICCAIVYGQMFGRGARWFTYAEEPGWLCSASSCTALERFFFRRPSS